MSELYELPDGWEWINLDNYSNVTSSKRVHKKDYIEDGIPFFRSKEIILKSKSIEPTNILYISEDTFNEFRLKFGVPKKGDILITAVGTLGVTYLVDENDNFYFKDGNLLWIRDIKENIVKEYLLYYFKSQMFINEIDEVSKGAAQKALTITKLVRLNIPLPPLLEQQRIVSKLDLLFEKIDKSIALHQKNMNEADLFMGSVLNDVFGELEEKYGLIKINHVVIKTNNINPMNDLDKPFTYIDISSIDNKSFKIVEPKQLIGSEAPSRAKKGVLLGDIMYATTRPNLKNISIVREEYDNPIASTGFCVLRVNANTLNSYLFYYVITDKLFEQIEPNIRGAQYPATSDKDLKNCNIPNTPLNIQKKIVKYLDEISEKTEKIKSVQKEKMDSLVALKASILDKAFRGEL